MKTQATSSLKGERGHACLILLSEAHAAEEGGDACLINFRF
jgi:hypothetical protein